MVFNGLLIIFDIRNITQWAHSFIGLGARRGGQE